MTNPMRAAGEAIARELRTGAWRTVHSEVVRLFPDVPAFGIQLRADADVLASAADRDLQRLVRDIATAWEHRLAVAVSRDPALEAAVVELAARPATQAAYTQNNTATGGGTIFGNQGGPQNIYRAP